MIDLTPFFERPSSDLSGQSALVTGASSGIGLATACALAEKGVNLKLTARRTDRLEAIQSALLLRFPDLTIDILAGDLALSPTWVDLERAGFFKVDILINNAGLALGKEPVSQLSSADMQRMIDLNITAALEVLRRCTPHMLEKGQGDLVCLSSIAAHTPYEGGSVYCASKHALRAFCTALRHETCGQNIRVIQISPGMVETEFSVVRFGSQAKANSLYEGMIPLSPQDIARQILHALNEPRHLTLDEMVVMASAQGGVNKVVRSESP